MDETTLAALASQACATARSSGAEAADTIVQHSRVIEIEIEKNSIRSCETSYDAGYGIRAIVKGGAGYARGRGLPHAEVERSASLAAEIAAVSEPDPAFRDLPHPAHATPVPGLFDPAIESMPVADAISLALAAIDAARDISPEAIVKGAVTISSSHSALANTNGVSVTSSGTSFDMYIVAIIHRGGRVGSFYEYTSTRRLSDIRPPEEIARVAVETAGRMIDCRKMPSGTFPVVIAPHAFSSLLSGVIAAASAEEIQRGRSFLAGKRGTRIAAPCLSIIEDPLCPAGLASAAFDGEGVPRSRAPFIESGVLSTYLHNSYTAAKSGEPNNAHASRRSYASDVSIGFSNIRVATGTRSESELIASIADGLYVISASIDPNSITGQISGMVDYGFRIIDGAIAHPVENVMLGGDAFSFLGAIEDISSDFRSDPGSVMPSALLGSVAVAGGE